MSFTFLSNHSPSTDSGSDEGLVAELVVVLYDREIKVLLVRLLDEAEDIHSP